MGSCYSAQSHTLSPSHSSPIARPETTAPVPSHTPLLTCTLTNTYSPRRRHHPAPTVERSTRTPHLTLVALTKDQVPADPAPPRPPSSKTVVFASPLTSEPVSDVPKLGSASSSAKSSLLSRLRGRRAPWRTAKVAQRKPSHEQRETQQPLVAEDDEVVGITSVTSHLATFAFTPSLVTYVPSVDIVTISPPPPSLFSRLRKLVRSRPVPTMASTTTRPTSALKPPSTFGFSTSVATPRAPDKPPALPPKSTKLLRPTALPVAKLFGSKSIGNVNSAPSDSSPFTSANSCDNLAAGTRKNRSSTSSTSDVSSPTLSSASSISSFKAKCSGNPEGTSGSRLPAAQSAYFNANGRGSNPVESRFSNRSSSSSNISADSGHNSGSSSGPSGAKSTVNLTSKSSANKTSFLPTAKSATAVNALGTKIAKPTMSNHIPRSKAHAQTAHIVSTPGPVVDRGAPGLPTIAPRPQYPSPTTQFPSMTKFAQHQSQLYSQRLQFLYGSAAAASTVPNGTTARSPAVTNSTSSNHTYSSGQPATSPGSNIVRNGHGPARIVSPVVRRTPSIKSPQQQQQHGLTNAEQHKPYKRPNAPAVTSTTKEATSSPFPRYQTATSGQSSLSNGGAPSPHCYTASYVRNAVNRLNSQTETPAPPPLPPKGLSTANGLYYRFDQNGNNLPAHPPPTIPPKGLPRPGQVELLTRQTAGLNLKVHAPPSTVVSRADQNGNFGAPESEPNSGDYNSLTYKVVRRRLGGEPPTGTAPITANYPKTGSPAAAVTAAESSTRAAEMSFVAALVSRQQLAAAAAAQDSLHNQDDTDVEDELEEELNSGSSSGCPTHPHHHHHLMSASICSTASTASSFCFESAGGGPGSSSQSSGGTPTPGATRKVRTESSASCTTISQESTKDWIDDEIADQPDLFMAGKVTQEEASAAPNRAHFHLNFHNSDLSPTKTITPSMDDSATPTNTSFPSPLRLVNHELESLIAQYSPRGTSADEFTSLPPFAGYHGGGPAVDRSRSFSFNHAQHQGPTTPTGAGPSSPGSFGSPRISASNLKKRHSYTANCSPNSTSQVQSQSLFRRPRPLSFVETADGALGLDSPSLRAVSQDVIGIKTLLFRLQGVLQNAETSNPFESSFRHHSHLSNRSSLDSLHSYHHERTYSNCSETSDRADPETVQSLREENFDLRQELKLLQEEMIDKDRTIRLLQQQMAKYTTGYIEPLAGPGDPKRRPEMTNSTTQTETCANEDGINPRALSDGSNGQLVRFCCTHQMDLV